MDGANLSPLTGVPPPGFFVSRSTTTTSLPIRGLSAVGNDAGGEKNGGPKGCAEFGLGLCAPRSKIPADIGFPSPAHQFPPNGFGAIAPRPQAKLGATQHQPFARHYTSPPISYLDSPGEGGERLRRVLAAQGRAMRASRQNRDRLKRRYGRETVWGAVTVSIRTMHHFRFQAKSAVLLEPGNLPHPDP
jgi:hypothetical protein